jgi:hypothetical protein
VWRSAAQEVAAEAEASMPSGDGGERAAEEAHGGAGEVEEVAEGEVVDLGVAMARRVARSAPGAGGGGDGEVSADAAMRVVRGTRKSRGASGGRWWRRRLGVWRERVVRSARARRPPAMRRGRGGGEGVVLLAGGEGEEAEDEPAQRMRERAASCSRAVRVARLAEGADVVWRWRREGRWPRA